MSTQHPDPASIRDDDVVPSGRSGLLLFAFVSVFLVGFFLGAALLAYWNRPPRTLPGHLYMELRGAKEQLDVFESRSFVPQIASLRFVAKRHTLELYASDDGRTFILFEGGKPVVSDLFNGDSRAGSTWDRTFYYERNDSDVCLTFARDVVTDELKNIFYHITLPPNDEIPKLHLRYFDDDVDGLWDHFWINETRYRREEGLFGWKLRKGADEQAEPASLEPEPSPTHQPEVPQGTEKEATP